MESFVMVSWKAIRRKSLSFPDHPPFWSLSQLTMQSKWETEYKGSPEVSWQNVLNSLRFFTLRVWFSCFFVKHVYRELMIHTNLHNHKQAPINLTFRQIIKTEEDLSDEETQQKEFKVTLINKMHVGNHLILIFSFVSSSVLPTQNTNVFLLSHTAY